MPIYQMMLDIAQQQAQIQGAELHNKMLGLEITNTVKKNQLEDQTRTNIAKLELLRVANADKNNPDTGPMDEVPPQMREAVRGLETAKTDYQFFSRYAAAARGTSLEKGYNDRADAARKEIERFDKDIRDERTKFEESMGAAAGSYKEQPEMALQKLNRLDPNWWRKLPLGAVDTENGKPIATDKTAQAMKALQYQSLKSVQQLQREEFATRAKEAEARIAETARKNKKDEERKAAEEHAKREAIQEKQQAKKEKSTELSNRDQIIIGQANASVASEIKTLKLEDTLTHKDMAEGILQKLADPKRGYEAISTPEARALVEAFKLEVTNNRALGGGGKYTDAQVKKMNSWLDLPGKFIETIGRGDTLIAKDVMRNMAGVLQNIADEKTMRAARMYFEEADNVTSRIGKNKSAGDLVRSPPGWRDLENKVNPITGHPYLVMRTSGGKTYAILGPKASDIFVIPDKYAPAEE